MLSLLPAQREEWKKREWRGEGKRSDCRSREEKMGRGKRSQRPRKRGGGGRAEGARVQLVAKKGRGKGGDRRKKRER